MNTELLSKEFSTLIRKELSIEELQKVIDRNKIYPFGSCATYDFLDANMVMDEAFTKAFGRDFDFASDLDGAYWNAAWDMSKTADFKTP